MYPLREEIGGTELTAFWIGSIFYVEIRPLWYYKTTDFMFWLRINLSLLEVSEVLQFQFSCFLKHWQFHFD